MILPNDLRLTPQHQAHIFASGMLAIITLGTLALIGLCLAALWLLVELATLLFQSVIEALSSIGATYQEADPLVRFLILVAISFVVYHVAQRYRRRH